MPQFANDQAEVLERMKSAQVTKAVVVATEEAEIAPVLTLARENDGLYAAFAVSPQDEALPDLTEEEIVLRVQDPKMVAVGETGLDYHYCQEPLDWQRNRFATHIRAANLANKPLIIHSREAAFDTLDILKANGAQNCGFVLHCFCGDWDFAKKALDLGGYLSFSGIVTFRSAQDIQEVARKAPDDRIFIETDSPYLAPVPLRGKRNEPSCRSISRPTERKEHRGYCGSYDAKCQSFFPDLNMLKLSLTLALCAQSLVCLAQSVTPGVPLAQQLQEAIAKDDAPKVAYMLRELAYDPNFYLPNGDTPLVFAIRMDAKVSVNQVLLRSFKINVKVPTLRGETPLMLASIKGDEALAQKLIDMGAPVNANYGWTALHYAASTGQTQMTRFLIDKGAEVNARTERGVTPLYMAARVIATPTVDVLLKAGADKTLCNDQGISPADIAKKRGDSTLAKKLAIKACAPWPVQEPGKMTDTTEGTSEPSDTIDVTAQDKKQ